MLILYYFVSCKFKYMRSYNDRKAQQSESSESSLDDERTKKTTNIPKVNKLANQQKKYNSQSEESSLSEEDSSEQQNQMPKQKLKPSNKKQKSSESDSSSENSIDHIEERIKMLQKDLEHRIDRHKKQSQTKLPSNNHIEIEKKQKLVKNVASPPLPKKVEVNPPFFKQEVPQSQNIHPNINYKKQPNFTKQHDHTKSEEAPAEKSIQKKNSPKKIKGKVFKEDDKIHTVSHPQKKKFQSKSNENSNMMLGQLNRANKQIEELITSVQQLRSENKQLREQLKGRKKKKPVQELLKLKQIKQMSGSSQAKLQKELQLLKIIESLQTKLKKSINKKIGKSRIGSSSSALLHKGLPTVALH